MEFWYWPVIGVLSVAAVALAFSVFSLRHGIREVTKGFEEKLKADTNTPILVSSGSRSVREMAAFLNTQLSVLRREQLRLRDGDTELKTAVTHISHDLRTPLTAICGYLDLLEREVRGEKAERYLSVIRERSRAMRALCEELLRYSILSAGAGELKKEPVSLGDILEESLAGFYGVFSERGLTPEIRMPKERVVCVLDRGALRRVFDNLLSNAARYSDGDLSLTLTPRGEIIFKNHAKKLGRVEAARLFDRFFTVETTRTSVGIGLSIAKMLTEQMGGRVTADYQGGCLLVTLCFPVL